MRLVRGGMFGLTPKLFQCSVEKLSVGSRPLRVEVTIPLYRNVCDV
jgi:hypothetical protein